MAGAGGILLLAGILAFDRITWAPLATLALPGLILLAAAPFLGAMPSPKEEGSRR